MKYSIKVNEVRAKDGTGAGAETEFPAEAY